MSDDMIDMSNGKVLKFSSDETIKFRVYELIIKVAGSSEKGFELAENDMLLDDVIAEVKSDDILIKINAIEMFMEVWNVQAVIRRVASEFDRYSADGCIPTWLSILEESQPIKLFSWFNEKWRWFRVICHCVCCYQVLWQTRVSEGIDIFSIAIDHDGF
jgi:hypothetical protein